MLAWLADVRHAVRSLSRNPGLVVVAALSLGLGIGANTSFFSLFRAIFLRDVSAQQPERLVQVWMGHGQVSYPDYLVLRGNRALADLAAYRVLSVALRSADGAERVYVQAVSNNFFDLLGVHPAQGRAFSRDDSETVILSDGCRQRRFGGDRNIVGRIITLNNRPFTIAGVLPPHYRSVIGYGVTPDFYLPLSPLLDPSLNKPENASLQLLGRLAAGVTPRQAESALAPAAQEFARLHPDQSRQSIEHRVAGLNSLEKLKRDEGGLLAPVLTFFGVLLGVVGLVLLIACANIGGLLLARGVSRRREIAVRLALGATPGRLIQHLLAESSVLAVLGAAVGLLLNLWLAEFLSKAPLPTQIPIDLNLAPDFRLLAYAMALCAGAALLSGLAPALQSIRPRLLSALKDKDLPLGGGRFNLRDALVIGQVSVSLVLLITSSLFLRSLLHLTRLDPGFNMDRSLYAVVTPDPIQYDAGRAIQFLETAMERIEKLPGVVSASGGSILPLNTGRIGGRVRVEGSTSPVEVLRNDVARNYFKTVGIPLLEGREFASSDRAGTPAVAIVNRTFARRHFNGVNPVGRTLQFLGPQQEVTRLEIVGVVADSKYVSLSEDPAPVLYRPYAQVYPGYLVLMIRTKTAPQNLLASVKGAIGSLDPAVPIQINTVESTLTFALFPSRIGAMLLGSLGTLGLLLAMIGFYGSMSHAVNQRRREIGIRMALGAKSRDILGMVLKRALVLEATGIGIGLLLSLGATWLVKSMLSGVGAADPLSFLAVAVILALVGLAASYGPACSASRIDPMASLRYE